MAYRRNPRWRAFAATTWAFALSSVLPGTAAAQLESGGAGKGKQKIEIELPNNKVKSPTTPRSPADLVEALLPAMSLFPSAACDRAMDQIGLAGPGSVPMLRMVLIGSDPKPRVPAALLLSQFRDVESVPSMVRLLEDDRASRHAGLLFDALASVSPEAAETTAARFAADRSTKRANLGLKYLKDHAGPQSVPALKGLLRAAKGPVREQAFQILSKMGGVDLSQESLDLLGNTNGSLCLQASAWLAKNATDSVRASLLERAEMSPPPRQASWALVTLAELLEDYDDPTLLKEFFTPQKVSDIGARLEAVAPLERLAAAIALAEWAFRDDSETAAIMLSERVLPTMMETFLSNQYFEDLLPLLTVSRTRVQRITGLDLGTDLARWRAAWSGSGGTPLVRRDLPPSRMMEYIDELVIRFQRRGLLLSGPDREIIFATDALLPVGEAPRGPAGALYLSSDQLTDLIEQLSDAGVFDRGRRNTVEATTGNRQIRIASGQRERAIVGNQEEDVGFDRAEAIIIAAADAAWWQRLYLGNPMDIGNYYRRQGPRFAADLPKEEWNASYIHALQVALPALDRPGRSRAIAVLLRREGLSEALSSTDLPNMLGALGNEPYPDGAWAILTEAVRRNGDPELRRLTISALVDGYGERAGDLVGHLLNDAATVSAALSDGRSLVRLFAVRAATTHGIADAHLTDLAENDADPRVRRAAVVALSRSDNVQQRERVVAYARSSASGLQNAALEALGDIDHRDAEAVLSEVAMGAPGPSRRAAMRGLATRGGGSLSTLKALANRDEATADDRQEAVAALGSARDPMSSDLLEELAASERPEVREEAACQLARRGDMRAASVLIALLDEPLRASRALDFLALLYCVDGGTQGETFVRLYQNEPYRSADEWFRQALLQDSSSILGEEIAGLPLYALLDALRDDRWFLRANALRRLEEEFGVELGALSRFATAEEYRAIADRWERYLETRTVFGAGT